MKRLLVLVVAVFACLLCTTVPAHSEEGGLLDVHLLLISGDFSGTWTWNVGAATYQQATVLQLSQGIIGPNTITGDGYLPWDWAGGGGCWYGVGPTYPCAGLQYILDPPNPPAHCPTSYNNTLFLCLDRAPTRYICHVTFGGTFNVFIGTAPPWPQLNTMTAYPQQDYKQPCPDTIKNTAFTMSFQPDGTDCDNGFCNENYRGTGTLMNGTAVSGSLLYNGD